MDGDPDVLRSSKEPILDTIWLDCLEIVRHNTTIRVPYPLGSSLPLRENEFTFVDQAELSQAYGIPIFSDPNTIVRAHRLATLERFDVPLDANEGVPPAVINVVEVTGARGTWMN